MYAATFEMVVDRGTTWQMVLTVADNNEDPIDISGVDFSGAVKDLHAADGSVAAVFEFEFVTDGTDGEVAIILPLEQTLLLKNKYSYRYDIFARFGDASLNDYVRILEGDLELRYNVTPIVPSP